MELSRTLLNIDIFTIIITQFYFYRVTPFNTGSLYLVLKCLIFCAHAINYCIFKRHQWLIQNLTMKTCSFRDPVTSKFLLIVNIKCELPWCIWKTKPLMPCPGYFPFSVADFFLRYWICTYTGRYKPKTKRVCTFFKYSGSIYFLHKQLSRNKLHRDAAESWKVRLTYGSNATAFTLQQNKAKLAIKL